MMFWGAFRMGKMGPEMFFDVSDGKTINSTVYIDQIMLGPLKEFWEEACGDVTEPVVLCSSAQKSVYSYASRTRNGLPSAPPRDGLPNSAGSSLFGLFGSRPNRTKPLFESCRTEQSQVLKVLFETNTNRTMVCSVRVCSGCSGKCSGQIQNDI